MAAVTTLVTYYPKPGQEEALLALVRKHWPTIGRLGLATSTPARVWRGADKRTGKAFIVELFEWRDSKSSEVAHQTPEVMKVWEPMGPLLETMTIAKLDEVDVSRDA
jgi:hypothetical protein